MFVKKVKDMEMPILGLGTWQMKGNTCKEAVESALEMGYRHIDTAEIYGNERAVGQGIKKSDVDRDGIFLTTKVQRTNLHHDDLIASVEESLEKLKTNYIDLLLIHWPSEDIPLDESIQAMRELKEQEKVKHIGVSNFTVELLREALEIESSVVCNQVEMHPFNQQQELLKFCQTNGVILTAYSPLAKGKVVGNEKLGEIGGKYDKSSAQVSLRWLIQQENVVAIPKSSKEEHQKENLGALNFHLDEEDMEKISNMDKNEREINPRFAPWR
jgi:2,5-diketo-D-gluconate reductase B